MEDKPILEHVGTYEDYKFAVIFQPLGYRCGYVQVPHWHNFYEEDYDDIPVRCHGGLTYSSHWFLDKKYPGWWIGFDCAHAGDAVDKESLAKYYEQELVSDFFIPNSSIGGYPTVKTLDYCIAECKSIIDQLVDME